MRQKGPKPAALAPSEQGMQQGSGCGEPIRRLVRERGHRTLSARSRRGSRIQLNPRAPRVSWSPLKGAEGEGTVRSKQNKYTVLVRFSLPGY